MPLGMLFMQRCEECFPQQAQTSPQLPPPKFDLVEKPGKMLNVSTLVCLFCGILSYSVGSDRKSEEWEMISLVWASRESNFARTLYPFSSMNKQQPWIFVLKGRETHLFKISSTLPHIHQLSVSASEVISVSWPSIVYLRGINHFSGSRPALSAQFSGWFLSPLSLLGSAVSSTHTGAWHCPLCLAHSFFSLISGGRETFIFHRHIILLTGSCSCSPEASPHTRRGCSEWGGRNGSQVYSGLLSGGMRLPGFAPQMVWIPPSAEFSQGFLVQLLSVRYSGPVTELLALHY